MKTALALLVLLTAPACSMLQREPGQPVDLVALADDIDLYRQDVLDLAPLATPDTQLSIAHLSDAVVQVEAALKAAGKGGPIDNVKSAAEAALSIAEQVVIELKATGRDTGDIQFYIGVLKVALRHLNVGDPAAASAAVK